MAAFILILLIVYVGAGIYVEYALQIEAANAKNEEFKMSWDWNNILTWPKNIKKIMKQ